MDSSTLVARRAMLLAFGICFAGIGLLASERLSVRSQVIDAAEQLQSTTAVADDILLADERATSAARMAVVTRDLSWISRHAEAIARIELAIARAKGLAPLDMKRQLDDVGTANNSLSKMEQDAFELLKAGDGARAKAIIESTAYRAQKALIADSISSLRSRLMDLARRDWEDLKEQSRWFIAGILTVVAAGLCFVWLRMMTTLSASEDVCRASEQQLKWMATHDSLTGLANRWRFIEEARTYKRAMKGDDKVAVFALDLDRFKPINDCYGHRVGDEVLKVVAKRLSQITPDGLVARIGGDEFGILLPFSGDEAPLPKFAARLLEAVAQQIYLANLCIEVGISIGYTICDADEEEPNPFSVEDGRAMEVTFRRADMALHAAKESGRGCFHRFEKEMDRKLFERVELESEIEVAIENGQIIPFYQPLIDMRSGQVVGFEVLARWMHPAKGLIPPSVLIPVAESTGTITAMTCHLLRQAIADAAAWPDDIVLSLNVSPMQFADSWLAGEILAITNDTQFSLRRLEIEVTEEALIANMAEACRILRSLRGLGVRTALDDFGAGYAGVRYLREFRFDRLKIDRSFVQGLSQNPEEEQVVKAIVRLARALKMETVAEGIEDRSTCDRLLKIGCTFGQGYFFAKPHPASEAERYFRNHESRLVA